MYVLLDNKLKSFEERNFVFQSRFYSPKKVSRKKCDVGPKICYTQECAAKDIGETGQNVFGSNKQ